MIHGERTNLRAVERTDARFLRDLLNAPSVQAGWGTGGVPVSIHRVEQEIEGWIEAERVTQRPTCLIVETLDGAPVGAIVIRTEGATATLSIAIEPLSQRHGYGHEALTAVIEALFDEWRLHRIELSCETDNEHAAHLYESLGFTLEGARRGATFTGGEWRDQQLYGLLATDPRPWMA